MRRDLKVVIGERLKRIRKEKGLTQKELAGRIKGKIDYTYIGKIERGEQLPSLKILKKISEGLSVPLSYFFVEKEVADLLGMVPEELKEIAANEGKRAILRRLEALHKDDIPFILEIIQILERHRRARTEEYLRVAEKGEEYYTRKRRLSKIDKIRERIREIERVLNQGRLSSQEEMDKIKVLFRNLRKELGF